MNQPIISPSAHSNLKYMIPETQEAYKKIMGIDQPDYDSRAVIKRDVLSYAKRKGYRTSRIHKMPKAQLKAIALNHQLEV